MYKELTNSLKDMVVSLRASLDVDIAGYNELVDQCCFSICNDIIRNKNIFNGEGKSIEEILKIMNADSQAEYLIQQILGVSCLGGILEKRNGKFYLQNTELDTSPEILVRMARKFPEEAATFQWLGRAY